MDGLLEKGYDIEQVDKVWLFSTESKFLLGSWILFAELVVCVWKIVVEQDGLTALHLAVIGKREAVISHLLRKGANPEARDQVWTKLREIHSWFQELWRVLWFYAQDGATPLHYAVQVGAMQTVKLLMKSKVDVNVADNVSPYFTFWWIYVRYNRMYTSYS